jgi:hypothetical protein
MMDEHAQDAEAVFLAGKPADFEPQSGSAAIGGDNNSAFPRNQVGRHWLGIFSDIGAF